MSLQRERLQVYGRLQGFSNGNREQNAAAKRAYQTRWLKLYILHFLILNPLNLTLITLVRHTVEVLQYVD
jgi:hypothetical protein